MGYKAEIKKLNQLLEMKQNQIDVLYAAVKAIIVEKGRTDDGNWNIQIPEFTPEEVNQKYVLVTEPKEGYFSMTVSERKESNEVH